MRRCEHVKMRRCEDEKMRRCEDEKMWRCEDVKMRRCEDEQMWRWEDVKMRRCEDETMWRWEDVKMRRCEVRRCEVRRCEVRRCEVRRCEDEKMWRWEDVKMRGCEDQKMWRWDTDPHYWKNPALRRSREQGNKKTILMATRAHEQEPILPPQVPSLKIGAVPEPSQVSCPWRGHVGRTMHCHSVSLVQFVFWFFKLCSVFFIFHMFAYVISIYIYIKFICWINKQIKNK